jgi:hypothetical protein
LTACQDAFGKKYWILKPYEGYKDRKLTRDAYACDLGVWDYDFELKIALK